MRRQGSITVFLSLSLLCIFALLCVMVEQARMAGSRYYFQVAVNASLDTLFSQYHRELWKRYRILGLQYENQSDVIRRLETYVEQYLEVENWYPMEVEYVGLDACENLTSQGGDFLTREVLEYMNYGIWDSLELIPQDGEQMWKDIQEAASAGTMSGTYDGQEKEVQKLEKAVDKLLDCVEAQEASAAAVMDALSADDPDDFYKAASRFRKEARKMDSLVTLYEKRMEQLRQAMEDGDSVLLETGEYFQQNRAEQFKQQMNPYREYIEEDGRRYQEILLQKEKSERNQVLLQETEERVEQLEEEYEERLREAEEDDDITAEELSLASAASLWSGYSPTHLQAKRQAGDAEKRGFLEQARDLAQGNLLKLVLPEDMLVSRGTFPAGALAEDLVDGESIENTNLAEKVLLNEYCGQFFLNALSEEQRQVQYELEYILQGENTDLENLQATVEQLFLVRQGLNLIHILSDSVKREEINGLAAVITGVTGLAPLLEITACFIMVVWAMGEAVMDLRVLMRGGRVSLWKSADEWQLSLEGLLNMGQERRCPDIGIAADISTDTKVNYEGIKEAGDLGQGLSYEGYLKLLLLAEEEDLQQERMLRVIQMNIQREEPGFSLGTCAYQVDIRGRACGKHVFFVLPLVENLIRGEEQYVLEAKVQKQY